MLEKIDVLELAKLWSFGMDSDIKAPSSDQSTKGQSDQKPQKFQAKILEISKKNLSNFTNNPKGQNYPIIPKFEKSSGFKSAH